MNQPEYNNQQHQKPQIYHQQQNHQQVRTSPQEFYHSAQISQQQANNQSVNRQQQFVGYQELQQSDQRYAPQNQTQHGMYQNEQPHKTSPQPVSTVNHRCTPKMFCSVCLCSVITADCVKVLCFEDTPVQRVNTIVMTHSPTFTGGFTRLKYSRCVFESQRRQT